MYTFKKSVTALAVAASIAISASAFAASTGGLKIHVVDSQGNPVAGATVMVKTPDSLTSGEGVSDADGYVNLRGLDPSNKYEVTINGSGFQPFMSDNVRVSSDKSLNLNYVMTSGSGSMETIEVTGRQLATIDTTSSQAGVDITLDMTESLPTARSYQSYLQLAPGTKPSDGGNPSSKSGVNYSDAVDSKGNTSGSSSDNVYYIDGIDVTDGTTGTYGANFNSEIIQEQQVITGGIPAKYAGGSGLVSRVVTKSGSNEWTGSINYYLQNDSLVSDNKHEPDSSFSTYDTAFTVGGPLIKDKLWFFASYQKKNRADDVSNPDTGTIQRSIDNDSEYGFAKLTYQMTDNDRFQLTYFNDPTDISGSSDPTVLNNRDRAQKQGGDNYKVEYTHTWDDLIISLNYYNHEAEISGFASDDSTRNDVLYAADSGASLEQLSKGGYGSNSIQFRNKKSYSIDLEYYLDTNWGEHTIEFGYSKITNTRKTDLLYTGDGAQYTSLSSDALGMSLGDYVNSNFTGDAAFVSDDYVRIVENIEKSSEKAYFVGVLDSNGDGTVDADEASAIVFDSTTNNPSGAVNSYRIAQTSAAPLEFQSEGGIVYVQDAWTYNDLTINLGLRAEQWKHFGTDGSNIYTFDWDIAPRLSAVYDINGDGESKVWAFAGRYYDPIRNDMTSFAGTLNGSVREEQIYIGEKWLTFRTRGGAQVQDAFFSPNTKTPYTDEILLGYSQSLTDDMSIEATYTKRKSGDILEDYDLHLYTETLAGTDYYLPLSYFGYDTLPNSNYVIGTLAGGERKYQGYELTFNKHRSDNWFMLASITYNDAEGNSNSDGNADFQGDVVWLDPRAPGMNGKQPGNIEWLAKVAGSYYFDNGIEIGAIYNWNSGLRYSETWSVSGRHLPIRVDSAYENGGVESRWVAENSVGAHTADSYGTLDVRVKYTHDFDGYKGEVFLDVFNLLDDQAADREQDLLAGDGAYAFGEASRWVDPRRIYLGARISF
ncbi:carboxypeptidase regulatory-like domain-containing protein [Alteromonadaceae bacterium BrNp21-10]|nr:carboxypeptidase regulatory-like domain-containing protein [Alteromonadaceae bacterium BrNp21-10]